MMQLLNYFKPSWDTHTHTETHTCPAPPSTFQFQSFACVILFYLASPPPSVPSGVYFSSVDPTIPQTLHTGCTYCTSASSSTILMDFRGSRSTSTLNEHLIKSSSKSINPKNSLGNCAFFKSVRFSGLLLDFRFSNFLLGWVEILLPGWVSHG